MRIEIEIPKAFEEHFNQDDSFEAIIKLDNGRYLRAVECQYSYIDEEVSNDVCECRKLKYFNSLLTSCGYVFGVENGFKYCPYCGRKIKGGIVDGEIN